MRHICKNKNCNNYVAVNYHKDNKIYYRSICDSCRKNVKNTKPRWVNAGYKKKSHCEKCGFKPKYIDQIYVYFCDGNMNNVHISNMKSICANCHIELTIDNKGWIQGDLQIDN